MSKYHISPTTGEVKKCTATTRSCPVGGEHFESKQEGVKYSEEKLSKKYGKLASYTKASSEELDEHLNEKAMESFGEDYAYSSMMNNRRNNSSNYMSNQYPVGSLVEIKSKYPSLQGKPIKENFFKKFKKDEDKVSDSNEKIIRGRIVASNEIDMVVVDTNTGKSYTFGEDEGAERYASDYDITFKSKAAPKIADDTVRAIDARENFDKSFNVGDRITLVSNFNYNSNENGDYTVYHKTDAAVTLEDTNGNLLTLSNDKLEENNYYNFMKFDENNDYANNKEFSDYRSGIDPYPVNGWSGNNEYNNIPTVG